MDPDNRRRSAPDLQFPPREPGGKDQTNAIGGQRPPLDGEVSPHEAPTPKAKAAVSQRQSAGIDQNEPQSLPGRLVGDEEGGDPERTAKPFPCERSGNLGRPNPNEDKDSNVEQLKAKDRVAHANSEWPNEAQGAERVDPTGETLAGERH
ncbi:hypothetical protein [Xanthobacter versatilis]|uniref:hypothetical protein n=1 Tax=Xanthobacter autotrophicus (strain ATCC BAA-1158 / Py2) TaxID=78245 RepID=UPI003726CBA2